MTTTIPNVGGDLDACITSVPDAENASLREFRVAIALYRRNDRTCVCVYVYIHVHIHIYTHTQHMYTRKRNKIVFSRSLLPRTLAKSC